MDKMRIASLALRERTLVQSRSRGVRMRRRRRAMFEDACACLLVSQALMLAISSGSLEAEAGLHFQLPPTIGLRDGVGRASPHRAQFLLVARFMKEHGPRTRSGGRTSTFA